MVATSRVFDEDAFTFEGQIRHLPAHSLLIDRPCLRDAPAGKLADPGNAEFVRLDAPGMFGILEVDEGRAARGEPISKLGQKCGLLARVEMSEHPENYGSGDLFGQGCQEEVLWMYSDPREPFRVSSQL